MMHCGAAPGDAGIRMYANGADWSSRKMARDEDMLRGFGEAARKLEKLRTKKG